MVEALAVVGLISNIAQFAEYGTRIVSDTIDVYKDQGGISKELEEMEVVFRNVTHGYQRLERKHLDQQQWANLQKKPSHRYPGDTAIQFDHTSDLELIRLYQPVIEELSLLLQQLKPRVGVDTKFEAFRVAMRRIRKKEELKTLEGRLERILKQISHHNVATLRYATPYTALESAR